MKKSFGLSLLLIICCFFIWLFWPFFPEKLSEIITARPNVINLKERKVFAPPPLKVIEEIKNNQTVLYQEKIIELTNRERKSRGLPDLLENLKLNQAAGAKLDDMLAYQYFEHQSPSGKEVDGLAADFSYQFIAIGENLAMGNFENEEKLIEGWMNSPGHRENILNSIYQEIGVAVKKGEFEGKTLWLAVQHFGLPITACPGPDESLNILIKQKQEELEQLENELFDLRIELQKIKPKWSPAYHNKTEEYNKLVEQYNNLLAEYKKLVDQYNHQVEEFNKCLETR